MTDESRGATVRIESLRKDYSNFRAINDVSLDIRAGEFVALLGPSGSGKSTILMSVAGFETPSGGRILLDGVDITSLPAHRRGIGVVFQRYALFPHMSVGENIAYPLRRRGAGKKEIESELVRALRLVSLEQYADRYPSQLSGGQQQRVAVARSLVFRPKLLLMDEPLGALDRKLRQQMQIELKLIHREVGTTIIMVTHDQEEALSMADRVAVLNEGQLEQIGPPGEIYRNPVNPFVAEFMSECNVVPVDILERDDQVVRVSLPGRGGFETILPADRCAAALTTGLLSIRPEGVVLVNEGGLRGRIVEQAFGGAHTSLLLDVEGTRILSRVPSTIGGFKVGDLVHFMIDGSQCRLFPAPQKMAATAVT